MKRPLKIKKEKEEKKERKKGKRGEEKNIQEKIDINSKSNTQTMESLVALIKFQIENKSFNVIQIRFFMTKRQIAYLPYNAV